MVTASLESLRDSVSVPHQHYQTRVAVFESVKCDIMVKNAIFMAFYGILRHFLVKIPTEFFVFCMVTFVYMYITALHGCQCWGFFKKLPQLGRGVEDVFPRRRSPSPRKLWFWRRWMQEEEEGAFWTLAYPSMTMMLAAPSFFRLDSRRRSLEWRRMRWKCFSALSFVIKISPRF